MKNRLLIGLLLLSIFTINAQQFYVNENFNAGRALPSGWSTTALSGTANWKIGSDGSNALAIPPGFAGEPGANSLDGSLININYGFFSSEKALS